MYPTLVSFRMSPRVVNARTMWEMFWQADAAAKEVLVGMPAVYRLYLAAGTGFHNMSLVWQECITVEGIEEAMRVPDVAVRCVHIAVGYGEQDEAGASEYCMYVHGLSTLQSLVQFEITRACLDGDLLSLDSGEVTRELHDYRLVKELMAKLGAEECWGMTDDGVEGQVGYGPYYGAEMVPFHFRKHGPQTVIAGLEDGIRPTREMYQEARNAEPLLHGYRRTMLRIVDLPWDEYWRRVREGEVMSCRLITRDDDERICSGQTARHLEADTVQNLWREKGGYPLDGSVRSIA